MIILNSFFAALGQMGDPRFRKVLFLGVGLTLGLLVATTFGFVWLVQFLVGPAVTLPWIGEITWLGDAAGVSSVLLMMVLSVFLMVPVASAFTSMFLDEVAQAVEDRHYPQLPPVPGVPLSEGLRDSLSFLGVLLAANLVALILYVIFAPLAPFIFWALNGFLLGREYFTLAAMRRLGREGARKLRSKHSVTIWMAGILMAVPLSVPLVNLLIPIIGAATFTHIYHHLDGRPS
ncbi:CysZ-like protein [Falsiruegeria litorea R37]|uniref:CysZ-like protein n=1 Tax=Falsiruegeria litorea R37 TaxID=1200284 RepID=A0A1Y5S148_9RHOB|nr:EI24 domain-containing protein [Falsiruegeria litorea]SLN28848.1 CysZ-like protein [Falsiruegeria litorea R37]